MNGHLPCEVDLLVLDVDGVLTDGSILIDADGREIKRFHVRDGTAVKYWLRVGKKLAILSGRDSPATAHRARELGVALLRQGAKDKREAFRELVAEAGTTEDRTAVVGDDLPDLPVLRVCGFPVAVADAAAEVRAAARYVTRRRGGHGAVREVVELLLRRMGLWAEIMKRYQ